jgi:hypothetical protein
MTTPTDEPTPNQDVPQTAEPTSTAVGRRTPKWLQRAELFLRILVRIYVGVLVVLLPWTRLWDSSPLFAHYPTIAIYAAHGAVRGLVSGLGMLNFWIALKDATNYRES